MNEDPERLLSSQSDADALARELLGSLRASAPPEGADQRVWQGVARHIALVAAGATMASSANASLASGNAVAAASAVKTGLAAKLVVIVGVGALGAGGATLLARSVANEQPRTVPARVAPLPTRDPAPVNALSPSVPIVPLATPSASCGRGPCEEPRPPKRMPRSTPTKTTRTDLLEKESALLIEARARLRAGQSGAARAALAELDASFPRGMLGQEREVLRIELLAAQGDVSGARNRARAFVAAHPKSPHNAQLARFLNPP